ncbi:MULTISPECIES: TIGR02452 family protein [Nostocales]|uniref:TIGR02452 family protein n=4 Tax=Nostocales TaxID=1161 RepID=A0A8S9T4V3_9CYAN|nr:TIGR02452 family protein [Tolypothrix bouteillei]KAF3887480.1 TIGR02452 family protein [Tolypothrix bouteillei VB521301]
MDSREKRAVIAQETLEIIKRGHYQNLLGETINIKEACLAAKTSSIHYSETMFKKVFAQRDNILKTKKSLNAISFTVSNETTLHAASRLVNDEGIEKVLCLNFASAKNPGGGFLNGSQAQEESLARATALYPCIAQMTQMYDTNRNLGSSLYTDDMIYSPGVPVIRDDNDELLNQPFLVSILTVPAVNAGAVRQKGKRSEIASIESTMLARTEKLLSVAAIHDYKVLVLGAWGCGVFKNNPQNVAEYFYHHLVENPNLNGFFEKVVFAVLDKSKDEYIITPFHTTFKTTRLDS